MTAPVRIQLSRAAGWRMPADTVKVDRSTKFGNPFVVGRFGTAQDCVDHYAAMLGGLDTVTGAGAPDLQHQTLARAYVAEHLGELRGKNLACWCRRGQPCHADVLLDLANRPQAEAAT